MTDLSVEASKAAVTVNKCLLGFCGVRRTTYPPVAGQVVLEKGQTMLALRDEIFVQVSPHRPSLLVALMCKGLQAADKRLPMVLHRPHPSTL